MAQPETTQVRGKDLLLALGAALLLVALSMLSQGSAG